MGYDYDDDDYSELFDDEELSEFVSRHGESDGDEGEEDDDDERLLQSVQEQVGGIEQRKNAGEFLFPSSSTEEVADVQGTSKSYDPFGTWDDEDAGEEWDERQEAQGLDSNAQQLQHALEKNKQCQEALKEMLVKIEEKKRKNAELQKVVKTLVKYEKYCERRMFNVNGSDAKLIATVSGLGSTKPRGNRKPVAGPEKNKDVQQLLSLRKSFKLKFKEWTAKEAEALKDAVKTQIQQHLFMQAMEEALQSHEPEKPLDVREEEIRNISDAEVKHHVHLVNWATVAKTALPGRTAKECKARWLNHEDGLINNGPWTKAEDLQLLSLAQEYQFSEWETVAERLGTNRTAAQCLVRYQRSLNANLWLKEWTREDDDLLRKTVEMCGEKDWETVAACMEGRTAPQVMHRWIQVLQQKRRGRWSVEEDRRLRWAVLICGAQQWKNIAAHVPGRTGTQCRERWRDVLDPELKHDEWTAEEDQKLEEAVKECGEHRWSAVAEVLKPRTDNQCFRRWKSLHPERRLQFRKEVEVKKYLPTYGRRAKERSALEPADVLSILEDDNRQSSDAPPAKLPRSKAKQKAAGTKGRVDVSVQEVENGNKQSGNVEPQAQAQAPAPKPPRSRGKRKATATVSLENEQSQGPAAEGEAQPPPPPPKRRRKTEANGVSKPKTRTRKAPAENSDTVPAEAASQNSETIPAKAASPAETGGNVNGPVAQERLQHPLGLHYAIDPRFVAANQAHRYTKQNRAARLAKMREKKSQRKT